MLIPACLFILLLPHGSAIAARNGVPAGRLPYSVSSYNINLAILPSGVCLPQTSAGVGIRIVELAGRCLAERSLEA